MHLHLTRVLAFPIFALFPNFDLTISPTAHFPLSLCAYLLSSTFCGKESSSSFALPFTRKCNIFRTLYDLAVPVLCPYKSSDVVPSREQLCCSHNQNIYDLFAWSLVEERVARCGPTTTGARPSFSGYSFTLRLWSEVVYISRVKHHNR
ncbi:hypothetical protein EDB87DRAFT_1324049 [Lactarius vividus]|nr:hypothetical protein EDB87DRAFT_1324049 [Lactarius vividus]